MSAQPFDEFAEVRVSWEEFLRFQQAYVGSEKVIWDDGRIVLAMTGGSERHDLVVMALATQIDAALSDGRCAVFAHNRQIKTGRRSYYPDLLVRCGRAAHPLFEDDAWLIVEVLSPSNTPAQQTAMLYAYQELPSIEAILFVDTARRVITVHHKHPDDPQWTETQTHAGTVTVKDLVLDFEAMWTRVDRRSSFD